MQSEVLNYRALLVLSATHNKEENVKPHVCQTSSYPDHSVRTGAIQRQDKEKEPTTSLKDDFFCVCVKFF